MAIATPERFYTHEEFMAMPDDGVRRWLIKGRLREVPSEFPEVPMTVRNRFHAKVMIRIGAALTVWLDAQPEPRGEVLGGEAGLRLPALPESTFGLDVAYVSADVMAAQNDDTTVVVGVPTLCVEILSPNDTIKKISEKTKTYLEAGVAIVWVADPYDQTVTIYNQSDRPMMYNIDQRIAEHVSMPGFSPMVCEFF